MTDTSTESGTEGRIYPSPNAGLRELASCYNHWTGKITESSFQVCVALMAANWAVHQSRDNLLDSFFPKLSVLTVMLAIAANLVASFVMASLHKSRFDAAQANPVDWRKGWASAESTPSKWPFDDEIVLWGRIFLHMRFWLPLLGGVFFVLGVICSD